MVFRKVYYIWIWMFAAFQVIISCRGTEKPPEDMVAQVNDSYLLLNQVEKNTPQNVDGELSLSIKKNIISRWVEKEALYLTALEEGVELNEDEKFMVDEYRKSLIVQKYLQRKLASDYPVSENEIENYYRDHKEEFQRETDELHIIHLFMEQYDKAIFREISESDDLLTIINKYFFKDKSNITQPNGDLGYVSVDELPEDFIRILNRLQTGKISAPIKTSEGYHFFQVLDRQRKGSIRNLKLVRDEIIWRLKKLKQDQERENIIRQAKQNVQIQTYLSKIQ